MKTSLIVDPSPIVRKVASHLLLTEGLLAVDVATAAEGLEVVRTQEPSIILIDSRVGDMEPLAMIRTIRSFNASVMPRIILTTIENEPMVASQAIGAGANEILIKPYDRFALREIIHPDLVAA